MARWDVATSAALSFTAIVTPFEVGLLGPPSFNALFVLNRLVDVIFVTDLCVHFFLMRRKQYTKVQTLAVRSHSLTYLTYLTLLPTYSLHLLTYVLTYLLTTLLTYLPSDLVRSQSEEVRRDFGFTWETDLRKLARSYLRGWFLPDLLSVAPCIFDVVQVIASHPIASRPIPSHLT
jgi:hypothetical protein